MRFIHIEKIKDNALLIRESSGACMGVILCTHQKCQTAQKIKWC